MVRWIKSQLVYLVARQNRLVQVIIQSGYENPAVLQEVLGADDALAVHSSFLPERCNG